MLLGFVFLARLPVCQRRSGHSGCGARRVVEGERISCWRVAQRDESDGSGDARIRENTRWRGNKKSLTGHRRPRRRAGRFTCHGKRETVWKRDAGLAHDEPGKPYKKDSHCKSRNSVVHGSALHGIITFGAAVPLIVSVIGKSAKKRVVQWAGDTAIP